MFYDRYRLLTAEPFAAITMATFVALASSAAQADPVPSPSGSAPAAQTPGSAAPAPPTPGSPTSPTPAEQAAYIKTLLKNLDPCAGPLELQSKTSLTPCTYVLGEGAFSIGYAAINIPGTIEATGSRGVTFTRDFFGHVSTYPSFATQIGVTRHSQISIIAPTSIETNVRLGTAASGISDLQVGYKQMVFANLKSGTLVSLQLTYGAPIGSKPFAAPGPSYTGEVIFGQALPERFGIIGGLPVSYEVVSTKGQGPNEYGFTFVPTLVPYWQSPGGTLVGVGITHSFSPNVTPLSIAALQLISRHIQVGVTYGGVNSFTDIAGPVPQIVRFNTAVHPTLLAVNLYFLVGESNIPPALIEAQKMEKLKAEQQKQQPQQ